MRVAIQKHNQQSSVNKPKQPDTGALKSPKSGQIYTPAETYRGFWLCLSLSLSLSLALALKSNHQTFLHESHLHFCQLLANLMQVAVLFLPSPRHSTFFPQLQLQLVQLVPLVTVALVVGTQLRTLLGKTPSTQLRLSAGALGITEDSPDVLTDR